MIEFFMIGNLGDNAVMNNASGKSILNFAVCRSDNFKNKDGEREVKKQWVDCSYVSDSKELQSYLTKGTLVHVKGWPEVKIHVKKDGDPIAVQHLRVSKIEILSKKKRED